MNSAKKFFFLQSKINLKHRAFFKVHFLLRSLKKKKHQIWPSKNQLYVKFQFVSNLLIFNCIKLVLELVLTPKLYPQADPLGLRGFPGPKIQ